MLLHYKSTNDIANAAETKHLLDSIEKKCPTLMRFITPVALKVTPLMKGIGNSIAEAKKDRWVIAASMSAHAAFAGAVGRHSRWFTGCECHDYIWTMPNTSEKETQRTQPFLRKPYVRGYNE